MSSLVGPGLKEFEVLELLVGDRLGKRGAYLSHFKIHGSASLLGNVKVAHGNYRLRIDDMNK